ncbi:tyrosinase [Plakobranchus ocellatus]|uniref:Tyrosinase n=1 Tax=Plakobranchus ocellatus TaxID=259542 RepID=A0AAV4B738_9GAST|nr:tyrosinase [Plakobranchus ocellatus]
MNDDPAGNTKEVQFIALMLQKRAMTSAIKVTMILPMQVVLNIEDEEGRNVSNKLFDKMQIRLIIPLLCVLLPSCLAKIWEISIPQSLQDCYNHAKHSNIETFVGSTFSWLCEAGLKREQLGEPVKFDSQKSGYYQQLYDKAVQLSPPVPSGKRGRRRGKRQADALPRCVRKEYRMLSDDERSRFHAAINSLKQDTTVEPNKYDAIALLHTGMASFTAHGGAGFPGWHRIYILMFETALREVDPTVCLPYWDSSLDNELDDPTQSHIWTADFFGTQQGPVLEGPFANWVTPEGAQLIRNVGSDGDLFTATNIEDVLSRTRHADIVTSADVEPRFDLEFHHAAVHVFCGGTMGQLDTAAFDPIFFMHHSFVDYLWELFRTNLRSLGADPEIYPDIEDAESRHHSTASTGFGDLTQADGYLDSLTDSYEYESAPICTARFPDCGSRYLTCLDRISRCVPIIPTGGIPGGPQVPPPNPPSPSTSCPKAQEKIYGLPVQNDFCCDKTCDSSEWAMIPVKVVNVRPPKFSGYGSFPVKDGRVDSSFDIYSPKAYSQTNRFISSKLGNPKTYKRCEGDESTGQVFLSSKGLNYDGYYKEAAIIDQRLAVSLSMGFVAIKKPVRGSFGVSKALIRAHDSCGRVCHAACKNEVTGKYEACSGAVALSTDLPLMFGTDYDDAVMSVFDYEFNNDCPSFKTESFFLTFYCDYHKDFPYADHHHVPVPEPSPSQKLPVPEPLPSHKQPVPEPQIPVELPSLSEGCRVTSKCTVDVACASQFRQCDMNNEMHVCRGSCRAYGRCQYGRYFLRLCPEGQYFDDIVKACVTGFCRKVAGAERILDERRSSGLSYNDHSHSHSHGHGHSHNDVQSLPRIRGNSRLSTSVSHSDHADQPTGRQPDRPFYSQLLSGFMRSLRG